MSRGGLQKRREQVLLIGQGKSSEDKKDEGHLAFLVTNVEGEM